MLDKIMIARFCKTWAVSYTTAKGIPRYIYIGDSLHDAVIAANSADIIRWWASKC